MPWYTSGSQIINTSDKSLKGLESFTCSLRLSVEEQRPEVSNDYTSVATNHYKYQSCTHLGNWEISGSFLFCFWRVLFRPLHLSFCGTWILKPHAWVGLDIPLSLETSKKDCQNIFFSCKSKSSMMPRASFPHDSTPHSAMACPRTGTAPASYCHLGKNHSHSPRTWGFKV